MRGRRGPTRLPLAAVLVLARRVLEDVREIWTEVPKGKGTKGRPVNRERVVKKMFLRGDSVILVLRNPN